MNALSHRAPLSFDEAGRALQPALGLLVAELEFISSKHAELTDTAVREELFEAVWTGFVLRRPDFSVPDDFAMFTRKGNARIRHPLREFLQKANAVADRLGLSPKQRLIAWTYGPTVSPRREPAGSYFGLPEGKRFLELEAAGGHPLGSGPARLKDDA